MKQFFSKTRRLHNLALFLLGAPAQTQYSKKDVFDVMTTKAEPWGRSKNGTNSKLTAAGPVSAVEPPYLAGALSG